MGKSDVYFSDFRAKNGMPIPKKLQALVRSAGIDKIDFKDRYVAIKIHFGEPGNLAYLRPNYAKAIVDVIKELGGKPFLVDCNTLYVGGRSNGLDHLDAAYENGFSPFSTGCHVVIADGIKGTDETLVPIDGEYITEAKIGTAIMDADIIITLNHFKGHELTGFGGCLKNIGMGCGSRAGKKEMHDSGKPFVHAEGCIGCGICQKNCAHDAITITDGIASIDQRKCVGCGRCVGACPKKTIELSNNNANKILNHKIAEYTYAVIKDKPNFHINMVMDISPNCDCHAENDAPILPDVGMFASFDPIAIDIACADACNKLEPMPNSALTDEKPVSHDHFINAHPETNWMTAIDHGVKLGLGSKEYNVIKV